MKHWYQLYLASLEIDPSSIRITRPNSLESLPGNSPVGSRMAIMLGGAAARSAEKLKAKLIKIAAHSLGTDAEKLTYAGGNVLAPDGRKHTWQDAVELAHRQFHNLPEGMDQVWRRSTSCKCQREMRYQWMERYTCIHAIHLSFIWFRWLLIQ